MTVRYRLINGCHHAKPLITLTSDFGFRDAFVAEMKGVILSLSPQTGIVDISHAIPPGDILHGAHVLRDAVATFPSDTIHVAVVDPGVGTARRRVLIESRSTQHNAFLIGPDNGLFSYFIQADSSYCAWEINKLKHLPQRLCTTFDGRDIFAPVAALLANGRTPEFFGSQIESEVQPLVSILPPAASIADGTIFGQITYIDIFGNASTTILRSSCAVAPSKARIVIGKSEYLLYDSYEAIPSGTPGGIFNSRGFLEIAAYRAPAADLLSLQPGVPVALSCSGHDDTAAPLLTEKN